MCYKENNRITYANIDEIDFKHAYDVIVVGLGTAGAYAAITAAKNKLKVLGIERLNCMGGTSTAGGVLGYYFGSSGGLFEDVDKKIDKYSGTVYTSSTRACGEAKIYVLEQELLSYGADIFYETICTGVFLDEHNKVKGIRVFHQEGFTDISCKVLIDGTGDSDICEMIGVKTYFGREMDGVTVPFTSVMTSIIDKRILGTNFDCGRVDQRDPWELSKAIIRSNSCHLKEKYTAEGGRMLFICPLLGIREGRFIEGKETLRLKDFFEGKITQKPVFYAYADVDKHGFDNAFESETLQDWTVASNLGAVNVTVPVPYEIMIPKGFLGILRAGRGMSMDRDMANCVRMIRDMQKAGEVAGNAAYLSIVNDCELEEIDYEQLRAMLEKTKCYDAANNRGFWFDGRGDNVERRRIEWLTDIDDIKKGLSSSKPGVAIWSCKLLHRNNKEITGALEEWLKADCENLSKHSAIALALCGVKSSLPHLRQIAEERDNFVLQDCRKHNQIRGVIAVYLIGKLRDVKMVDGLIEFIKPEEVNHPMYVREYSADGYWFNKIYFQFFSHSIMALIKIGRDYKDLRKKIQSALKEAVKDNEYISRITNYKEEDYIYSVVKNVGRIVESEICRW